MLALAVCIGSLVYIVLAAPKSTERSLLWLSSAFVSLAVKWAFVDPLIALFFPTDWRYSCNVINATGWCLVCCRSLFHKRQKVTDAKAHQAFSNVAP